MMDKPTEAECKRGIARESKKRSTPWCECMARSEMLFAMSIKLSLTSDHLMTTTITCDVEEQAALNSPNPKFRPHAFPDCRSRDSIPTQDPDNLSRKCIPDVKAISHREP